jgi:uncharacterized membrane protein
METQAKGRQKWRWRKLLQYFLQGLIILAPIIVTVWAVFSLFNYVDNILPNLIHSIFPVLFKPDEEGRIQKIPGLGFVVIVIIIVLMGWLSTSYIVGKMVDFLDTF